MRIDVIYNPFKWDSSNEEVKNDKIDQVLQNLKKVESSIMNGYSDDIDEAFNLPSIHQSFTPGK